MNQTNRRLLALYLAVGLQCGVLTMVVLTIVQPGQCPVAAILNHRAGCGTSELLWMLHLAAALGAAILGIHTAHAIATVINRTKKKEDR